MVDDMIKKATDLLEARYKKPVHTVAAILRTENGALYEGVNIDHFSGFVCAETSALAVAINNGVLKFESLVAVRKEDGGKIAIANPCGKCRQIFHDYAPGIRIVVSDGAKIEQKTVEELLPFAFVRQKEKIQSALKDEEAGEVVG